ncbi:alpha/beta fold hydrolase [Siccirubricoccus sp. KC 17139]|uniref:Alpha/beta fold hydrolase n=1 Tax=Siccirubricoccus soli TaxID=2899147 RepID=A0ABT1D1A5_9PROT|nr:alpha/beta fold hydrolase [Siccirubricoccus soli]MCO6415678.1 alpha/beta fold hydrolase [Siccirubricoccus soli]MCP2681810.1 alpha/beta fold hydrolase [Siccirubricoccus soli]
MIPFRARPPWLGGTLQTLRALRYPIPAALPAGHRLWLPLGDGDALAAMLHAPEAAAHRPLILLVHGLTGTEDDPYLREAAQGLLRRGFPVLRLNLRGSAFSQPRSTSHYHLGRSEDLAVALRALPAALVRHGVVVAGWSLGGSLSLLLLDRHLSEPGMPELLGVAALCPPLEPALAHAAIDANWLLGRALLAMYRREVLAVPAKDLPEPLRDAARTARCLTEFEAEVTAPRFGYPSYAVFCELNRPASVLPRLRRPALLLMAADDPLVPVDSLAGVDWRACPAVLKLVVRGGGHCGFYDWHWESLSVRALGAFCEGLAQGSSGKEALTAANEGEEAAASANAQAASSDAA